MGRKRAHPAPVENVEDEVSKKANKRQTLFSPIIRHWLVLPLALRNAPFSGGSAERLTAAFSISRWLRV
jgi:hypothetical protein